MSANSLVTATRVDEIATGGDVEEKRVKDRTLRKVKIRKRAQKRAGEGKVGKLKEKEEEPGNKTDIMEAKGGRVSGRAQQQTPGCQVREGYGNSSLYQQPLLPPSFCLP